MKTAGAANSLTAAAMNSPVAMPLSRASHAIKPCHPGTLVTGRCAEAPSPGISGPQKKHDHEQCSDSGQAARDRTEVISHHVQPWVVWVIGQAVNGRALDHEL